MSAKHNVGGVDGPRSQSPLTWKNPDVNEIPSWYSRKPYLHFDLPLSQQAASAYVTAPRTVVRHPFYPLLGYTLTRPRIKKCPPGSPKTFVKEQKERPIAYPSHKDGYIFSYYKSILEKPYEAWLEDHGLREAVTAFRRTGENNVSLAKQAFDFIKENPSCQIVVTDIESFFDKIDHNQLKTTWSFFTGDNKLSEDHYAVYKAITRFSIVERHKAYNLFGIRLSGRLNRGSSPKRLCTAKQFREKVIPRGLVKPGPGVSQGIGIPQGTSLSPLLSNMYMANLDSAMNQWIISLDGKYWRCCDDILIVIPRGDPKIILDKLDSQLNKLALTRSIGKTQTMNSTELSSQKQLQYLGFIFNGRDIMVRSSSIHRYHRKSKKAVWAAEIRQNQAIRDGQPQAPFRKRALYNMFTELPLRGTRIKKHKQNQKFRGNFSHYMYRSAKAMGSPRIAQQRRKMLKRFRAQVKRDKR